MYIRIVTVFWKAVLVAAGLASLGFAAAATDAPENVQVVQGMAIYLGVMPAQLVEGHPRMHPEAGMHGGIPSRGRRDHVVVALFDDATGQRIEDAQVTVAVMGPGLGSAWTPLESMRIADVITYGNYFTMPSEGTYRIQVRIRRPGHAQPIEAAFTHRHVER